MGEIREICGVSTENNELLIQLLLNSDGGLNLQDQEIPSNYLLGDGIRMYREWKKVKLHREHLTNCIFVYDKKLIPARMTSVKRTPRSPGENPFACCFKNKKTNEE